MKVIITKEQLKLLKPFINKKDRRVFTHGIVISKDIVYSTNGWVISIVDYQHNSIPAESTFIVEFPDKIKLGKNELKDKLLFDFENQTILDMEYNITYPMVTIEGGNQNVPTKEKIEWHFKGEFENKSHWDGSSFFQLMGKAVTEQQLIMHSYCAVDKSVYHICVSVDGEYVRVGRVLYQHCRDQKMLIVEPKKD